MPQGLIHRFEFIDQVQDWLRMIAHTGFQKQKLAADGSHVPQAGQGIGEVVEQAVAEDHVKRPEAAKGIDFHVRDVGLEMRIVSAQRGNVFFPAINADHLTALLAKELGQVADAAADVQNPLASQVQPERAKMVKPGAVNGLGLGGLEAFQAAADGRRLVGDIAVPNGNRVWSVGWREWDLRYARGVTAEPGMDQTGKITGESSLS
jgi:hypothetical protein